MKAKDRNHPGHGGGEETAGTVMTESLVIASRFCGPPAAAMAVTSADGSPRPGPCG